MRKRKSSALVNDEVFNCPHCGARFASRRAVRIHINACASRSAGLGAQPPLPPDGLPSGLPYEEASVFQNADQNQDTDPSGPHTAGDHREAHRNQDSPDRGEEETNEAAQFAPVPESQLPRIISLAFRRRAEQQKHDLPRNALRLLPLLCEHSAMFTDKILKVIKDEDFSADDIPWKSAAELHTFLDKYQVSAVFVRQHCHTICTSAAVLALVP